MKKKNKPSYEPAEIELISFEPSDIITASDASSGTLGGEGSSSWDNNGWT